jgi:hypothetical protein
VGDGAADNRCGLKGELRNYLLSSYLLEPLDHGRKLDRRCYFDGKSIVLVRKPCYGEAKSCKIKPVYSCNHEIDQTKRGTTIRSSEPDLTIVVGNGNAIKEFQCHKAILSYASSKLDVIISAMASSTESRLILPYLNPEGWEPFYSCIDPSQNGLYLVDTELYEQVKNLAPWFAEFEMNNYLRCCEEIFHDLIYDSDDLKELLNVLQLAIKLNFRQIKLYAEQHLEMLITDEPDGMDLNTLQVAVSLCLPIIRNTRQDPFLSESCPVLWGSLMSSIDTHHLAAFKRNVVDTSDCDMFTHLLYCFIRLEDASY